MVEVVGFVTKVAQTAASKGDISLVFCFFELLLKPGNTVKAVFVDGPEVDGFCRIRSQDIRISGILDTCTRVEPNGTG